MSAQKGSNGIMDGQRNVQAFLDWAAHCDDFKPYIVQGLLNVSRVANECGLNRNVFYTNPEIRDIHWPALTKRLEDEGVLTARVAKPLEDAPRQRARSIENDARIKQIQEENEAVKAENRELRKQLERLKGIDEILHTTGRLPW